MHGVTTIDTGYADTERLAAAFLIVEGDEAAFVETNTSLAVPRLLAALEAAGRTPEDVRWIIITHVHLDHAGGAGTLMKACPNATLLAHPKAARHIVAPEKLVKSSMAVYGEEAFRKLYGPIEAVPEERVRIMEDGEELSWGDRTLRFFYTRGHANHHFCIHDSRSNGVFVGDSFGLRYPHLQSEGLFVFPTTTPTDFDPEAAHRSVDAIVATGAERVFFTHFGESEDVAAVAEALHPQLKALADVVDHADEAGLDGDVLDAHCRERVDAILGDALRARGLDVDPQQDPIVSFDADLNAQGLAFAVRKRRFKRQQG